MNPRPDDACAGAIVELSGVARTYPGPVPVEALRPTDLTLFAGDYVAITGPSGSGKTTLLNILGLLDTPTAGSLWIDGVSTARLGEQARAGLRATRIGFVFQHYHLLTRHTAVENVETGLLYTGTPRRQRRERAIAALDALGLTSRMWATPRELSGGERQRVAVARALVRDPNLLLCDEPTGNLDRATSIQVLDLLDTLRDGRRTIVVITHDPGVARRCRRQLTIVDGTVTELPVVAQR